jgi:hypothetical protein
MSSMVARLMTKLSMVIMIAIRRSLTTKKTWMADQVRHDDVREREVKPRSELRCQAFKCNRPISSA